MKIFLSVGHSILKNGNVTSADGRSMGGCLEYAFCKELAPYVKKYLERAGHNVTMVICPEGKFAVSNDEMRYKLNIENNGDFDLAVELHLNAFNGQAFGSEVYYMSGAGKKYADAVVSKLGTVFHNRGSVENPHLYMLNKTKATAILVEIFFCDNSSDYQKALNAGFDNLGRKIAEGIHGSTIKTDGEVDASKLYYVQVGAFKNHANALKALEDAKKKGFKDAFIKEF